MEEEFETFRIVEISSSLHVSHRIFPVVLEFNLLMSFFYLFLITPKHLFLQENKSFHIRHEQIYADTLRTLCQHRHRRRLTKGTKGQTETKNEIFKSIPGRGRSSTLTIHFYKRKKWNSIWFTLVRDEILLRLSSTSGSPGRRREPIGDLIPRVNCDAAAGLRSAAEHEAAFRLGRTCRRSAPAEQHTATALLFYLPHFDYIL